MNESVKDAEILQPTGALVREFSGGRKVTATKRQKRLDEVLGRGLWYSPPEPEGIAPIVPLQQLECIELESDRKTDLVAGS